MKHDDKDTDVTGTEPEGKPAKAASTQEVSNKRPIWSAKLNRAECAMWAYHQEGQTRHSVAIFREFFDKREKQMRRGFYFDVSDLEDVRSLAKTALEKSSELLGESGASQTA